MDVGQPAVGAIVVERHSLMIQSQQVEDRGPEIIYRGHSLHRPAAEGVGQAMAYPALDPVPIIQQVNPSGL